MDFTCIQNLYYESEDFMEIGQCTHFSTLRSKGDFEILQHLVAECSNEQKTVSSLILSYCDYK